MGNGKDQAAEIFRSARVAANDRLIEEVDEELRSYARMLVRARRIFFDAAVEAGFTEDQAFVFCMAAPLHD